MLVSPIPLKPVCRERLKKWPTSPTSWADVSAPDGTFPGETTDGQSDERDGVLNGFSLNRVR